MSKVKHTPGPWKVQTDFNGKAKLDRLNGYTVDQDDPKEGRPFVVSTWSLPNAHLIAAAPDLLEALRYARRFLNAQDHDTAYIDAIIAKAEGRP